VVAPFEEVSQKILPKLAGIRLCESTAQRTTEMVGQGLSCLILLQERVEGFIRCGAGLGHPDLMQVGLGQQRPPPTTAPSAIEIRL
jgi:hypothetical protein